MKKSLLKQMIKEELLKEETGYYWRLPIKIIGNELYRVQKILPNLYNTVSKGNDFDMEQFDGIIKKLNIIKSSAKKFKAGENPSKGF